MGCHPQCEACNGPNAGPAGQGGFASYIPPDYGHLRGMGNGNYGIFKLLSSSELPPLGLHGLGKSSRGSDAASTSATRNWSVGLRGLGKASTGTDSATTYATRNWSFGLRGLGQGTDQTSSDFSKKLNALLDAFRPGASEADVIVNQAQNPLMANLGQITNQFL